MQSFKVGRSQGSSENLNRSYAYNSFGDLTALTEGTDSYAFSYDGLGRLTAAYGRTYSYDGANRLTAFNGQQLGYGDAGPYHAVDRIGNADRFDYDANGNMTTRNKGLADQQTLVWNAENHLSEVQDSAGDMIERYWYDIGGSRVKKVSGSTTTYTLFGHYEEEVSGATTTYTFFGHYEEEVSGGRTTEIRHYSFGSLRIAVKRGSTIYHLHGDHLGSTSLTTLSSTSVASRAYYAYGSERAASGDLQTDRTFTGQKSDASGLLYYNARYYDPALGAFISPDTVVPNPGRVIDYNRFLYARGNPLKYTDPSGHASAESIQNWKANDRWYRASGWAWGGSHWNMPIEPEFVDSAILRDKFLEAGINIGTGWEPEVSAIHFRNLRLLWEGVEALAKKIGTEILQKGTQAGLAHLKISIDGKVTWYRAVSGRDFTLCHFGAACALEPGKIGFYDGLFMQGNLTIAEHRNLIRATAVHELAHKIHIHKFSGGGTCKSPPSIKTSVCLLDQEIGELYWNSNPISGYDIFDWEQWAELLADWVYGSDYTPRPEHQTPRNHVNLDQIDSIEGILGP